MEKVIREDLVERRVGEWPTRRAVLLEKRRLLDEKPAGFDVARKPDVIDALEIVGVVSTHRTTTGR
jgi:hypothetical protein